MYTHVVRVAFAFLIALLVSSCGSPLDGSTPEEAVSKSTGLSHTIAFHGRRSGFDTFGYIVLLSTDSVDAQGQVHGRRYWYRRTSWRGAWSAGDGGFCASDHTPVPYGRFIAINAHRHNNIAGYNHDQQDFSVIYGRTLSPDVAAVEVRFADGQVLRDTVTNQMFFIAVKSVVAACEVSIRNTTGSVVQQFTPSYTTQDGRDGPPPDTSTCSPILK